MNILNLLSKIYNASALEDSSYPLTTCGCCIMQHGDVMHGNIPMFLV